MKAYILMILIGAILASTKSPRGTPAKNAQGVEDQKLRTIQA